MEVLVTDSRIYEQWILMQFRTWKLQNNIGG